MWVILLLCVDHILNRTPLGTTSWNSGEDSNLNLGKDLLVEKMCHSKIILKTKQQGTPKKD